MILKDILIRIWGRKRRKRFFDRISSENSFKVKEQKKYYEMIFEDGCQTMLSKKMFVFLNRLSEGDRAGLTIGKNTYLQNLHLGVQQDHQVSIGSFCSFGPNVAIKLDGVRGKMQFTQYPIHLIDANAHVLQKQKEITRNLFVTIGNDCFIGEDCRIMGNVTIGDGVIIGERSLVPFGKRLEPFGIYVGQPVKLVGYRYDKDIIAEILRIQWWEWPLKKIQESGLQHIDFISQKEEVKKKLQAIE